MLTSDRLSVSVRSCFGTGESAGHTEEFHGKIGHHVTTQRAHLWWQITVVKDAFEILLTWDHHVCARVDQWLDIINNINIIILLNDDCNLEGFSFKHL